MRICLLSSGSRGNAAIIEVETTRLLIDAGLSARELCRRMALVGVEPETIDALLITHEHADHISALGPLVRRFNFPVYLHSKLAGILRDVGRTEAVREFDTMNALSIKDALIKAFPTTHDAQAPVGFTVDGSKGKIGFVTDLGMVTRLIERSLQNCRVLIMETNHDAEMLRDGPYPWTLKQRIKSNHGHLSNLACSHLLQDLLWPDLEAVFLAHISETNNTPSLALSALQSVLAKQNLCSPVLHVGLPDQPTGWFEL